MNKFRFKLYPRELLFSFFIVMLPASLPLEINFGITQVAYADEILCIICGFYILYLSFKKGIKGSDFALIVLFIICALIGLIGNAFSKVISNLLPIIVDLICLAKMFFVFLVYKEVAKADAKMIMMKYLCNIAKLTIILGAIFGTISLFVDLGMSGEKRYGIPSFGFIFQNEGRYGYIVACCLIIILICEKRKNKIHFYELLSALNIIYTTKGVCYIILVCYIIFNIMWRKRDKLSPGNIVALIIGGTLASSLQINIYLRDYNSPRVRLIRYGFKTANKYFPFGSGFATYGSDMAMKNYSKLYDLYGFNKLYGLSREVGNCLNDCYLGMVVGQFGYIGTAIFVIMLFMVFIPINKINLGKKVKALAISIFIGLVISSIGTAIIKSSIGVFTFAILGIVCGYSQRKKASQKTLRND